MKKRLLALTLCAAMLVSAVLTGCQNGGTTESNNSVVSNTESAASSSSDSSIPEDGGFKTISYEASKDKYRNYYEIFVYSFCDSDGDGIGDFKGLTSKLDYLNDDKSYGTLEDFKTFLSEAHKRGINVIIDFVINHTSNTNEWFKKAKEELKEGKTDGYAQYYNFVQSDSKPADVGASKYYYAGTKGWYYESAFTQNMPDLNLKNEKVRKEIEGICDFWLKDIGIDGFRLDAAYHYDQNSNESINDIKWLYDYCKSIKDDVYMVGEVWMGGNVISDFYKSGADSFFNFDMQGTSGQVATKAVNLKNVKGYYDYVKSWVDTITENNSKAISAPFISNHDTARSAGFLTRNTQKEKNAAMAYLLTPGNPFIYYGEEIGMTGSGEDPDKRTGMVWSLSDNTGYVASIPGATTNTEKPEEGVAEAQKNENSLLNLYKKVIRLKLQNPEIARGTFTPVTLDENNKAVGAFISEYNGSKVMVILNLSDKATVTVPKSAMSYSGVRGYIVSDTTNTEKVELNGEQLTIPANSVVVLK